VRFGAHVRFEVRSWRHRCAWPLHRQVRTRDQFAAVDAGFGHCDADACFYVDQVLVDLARFGELEHDLVQVRVDVARERARIGQREFVPAEARQARVRGHGRLQPARDQLQDRVADRMAERVVERAEVVQSQHGHAERLHAFAQQRIQHSEHGVAMRQSGELVAMGQARCGRAAAGAR
jgi:hypothetical protein